ncbi:MAG: SOS response-associated peptidase [Actinomycetota bacterium]
MCGRFSLSGDVDFYAEYFGATPEPGESLQPSWNVAPTDRVYVVAERDNRRTIRTMRWGLIPHWANNDRVSHINARAETVASTPAFRDSLSRKRCIIPADGFYEWEPKERGRTPHWVFRADGYPVGFAGIWSTWRDPTKGELVRSCAIVTAAATGVIAALHHRMPVGLPPGAWSGWLDRRATDPDQVRTHLHPLDPGIWMEREVSPRVNSVRNNDDRLQDPPDQGRLL